MYAVQSINEVETRQDISEIKKVISRFVKKRKTAIILKNGIEIGWIGEDLSIRTGWGYFINENQ